MKSTTPTPSCEDVLDAFAIEQNHDKATLERYLQRFPQYAIELAHLSHELSRAPIEPTELSANDHAAIDDAWQRYSSSPSGASTNVFTALQVPQLRQLASKLGVPRQIISAFRDQRVIVSSIPAGFLSRVAETLNTTVDEIRQALITPSVISYDRSHKADEKPAKSPPITFEQLLVEAQVSDSERAKLMAEDK